MNLPRHSRLHPNGVLITTLPDGREIHIDTVRCCHCQRHWVWTPDKIKQLGFCTNCTGFTCGSPECALCVNWEQKLDNREAGRPRNYTPPKKVSLWTPFVSRLDGPA